MARAALPALALLLAGCGSAGTPAGRDRAGGDDSAAASAPPSSSASASGAAADRVGECGPGDPALRDAARLARADLDGDGRRDRVLLTSADAVGCPGTLVAEVAGGYLAGPAPEGPAVVSGATVRLPGSRSDLLLTTQQHPRGGSQARLVAAADGALVELQDEDGNALVPFVATDTAPAPVSVTCGPGRVVVTEAVAHEPPGVLLTWDVRRTTYAVDGGRAERTSREEVADNVLPGRLRARFPELARAQVLADCRR